MISFPEWSPPIDDGGLDITKYSIEKRDSEKLIWIKVAEVEKAIVSYCVQKLLPNAQYIFRVVAENPIGTSEPIESDAVAIKIKTGNTIYSTKFHYYQLYIRLKNYCRCSKSTKSTIRNIWHDK